MSGDARGQDQGGLSHSPETTRMTPIKTVGILGLGKMGGPMAKHIISKGIEVVGYDAAAA